MNNKNTTGKLILQQETIAVLQSNELDIVHGGADDGGDDANPGKKRRKCNPLLTSTAALTRCYDPPPP